MYLALYEERTWAKVEITKIAAKTILIIKYGVPIIL